MPLCTFGTNVVVSEGIALLGQPFSLGYSWEGLAKLSLNGFIASVYETFNKALVHAGATTACQ